MYYGSGTVDAIIASEHLRTAAYAAAGGRQVDAACALTRWQHLSAWKNVMAAIVEVWRQVENPTLSLVAENSCVKFHIDPIWNVGALGFLKSFTPTRTTT